MNEPRTTPANSRRRTFRRLLLVAIAIPLVLFTLSLFGFFPWSGLNCWDSEIDINSGRIRHTRYLFWIPYARSVEDSALTRALTPEDLAEQPADWHTVVTLSPGLRHSPHYYFHGATYQIHEIEICWKTGKMTPAARREMGRNVVRLWRETGNDFRANDYIQTVWEKALKTGNQGKAMDVVDLPMPISREGKGGS